MKNRTVHPAPRRIAALIALLPLALATRAQAETMLEPQVVTASPLADPLVVVTDPRAARQPIPAQDGADILKTVPGFNVIRKGGTDGDPLFRGMAGSRLNILLDGENIHGGCGGRMDPPTAYVFPDAYDRITVIKGPQSVLHGPGSSAATVLFERTREPAQAAASRVYGSLTAGSFGRNDQVLEARHATSAFYVRGTGTRTEAQDYRDGDGNEVHSRYERWSTSGALGWTPDADSFVELSGAVSDGRAAYADRTMDGVEFARENVGLRFEKRNLSPVLEEVSAHIYRNYIDHVMDNFHLRTPPGMRMVNNPDRETVGGRVAVALRPASGTRLEIGVDGQDNEHSLRTGVNYRSKPRVDDAEFHQRGLFGELEQALGERDRFVAGLRVDEWKATDQRASGPWVTRGQTRRDTLESGFVRWEHEQAAMPATTYVGLGHAERFPDYWELISQNKQSMTSNSAFLTSPEKTTQLDAGLLWDEGPLSASVSAFYADIDDFILIDTVSRPGVTVVRNVQARTWGLEAGARYAFARNWTADATLAWVRGENRSDGTPLAQLPPLEARFGLAWDDGTWSAGALWRLVAAQERVDPGRGNIVGQDIDETPGFGVFSVNAGYRMDRRLRLAAGIDNVFDKTYAEHVSRAGAAVAGFEQTTRVNEPGRTMWVKASLTLD